MAPVNHPLYSTRFTINDGETNGEILFGISVSPTPGSFYNKQRAIGFSHFWHNRNDYTFNRTQGFIRTIVLSFHATMDDHPPDINIWSNYLDHY